MNVNAELPGAGPQSPVAAAWQRGPADDLLVIPDGCWDILVDPASGDLWVVGAMTKPREISPDVPLGIFGVRLRPGLLKHLLGVSALELQDAVVPLKDLAPRLAGTIEASGLHRRGLLEAISDRWRHADPGQSLQARLDRAVAILSAPAPGDAPPQVALAAEAISVSPRQLERLFLEHVGTPPKYFQRVMRLHAALRALRQPVTPAGLLADAALAGGYADQSHFTREAGALTGRTPRQLQALLQGAA